MFSKVRMWRINFSHVRTWTNFYCIFFCWQGYFCGIKPVGSVPPVHTWHTRNFSSIIDNMIWVGVSFNKEPLFYFARTTQILKLASFAGIFNFDMSYKAKSLHKTYSNTAWYMILHVLGHAGIGSRLLFITFFFIFYFLYILFFKASEAL